jgi:hypothetical protein
MTRARVCVRAVISRTCVAGDVEVELNASARATSLSLDAGQCVT